MNRHMKNKGAFERMIWYDGLEFGKIRPMDIDCFLDFRGKLFVMFEFKRTGAEFPDAQRWAYEKLCSASKVPFYVIVADWEDMPDAQLATVRTYYSNIGPRAHCWSKPKSKIDTRSAVRHLLKMLDLSHFDIPPPTAANQ